MTMMSNISRESSSFKDPCGYLFTQDNRLYRAIHKTYTTEFDTLMNSGLYKELTDKGLLIEHIDTTAIPLPEEGIYKIIMPDTIPFISYPYEWCFSQLKDAALLTLRIQKIALQYGMSLKDASAYNVQFHQGQAIFIDTLSFEIHEEGSPWVAYKQFVEHFLCPLLLISNTDIRFNQFCKHFIDGIPVDLTSNLLPFRTKLNYHILTHVHLHAKSQKKYENRTIRKTQSKVSNIALLGIIDSLEQTIKKLRMLSQDTEWGDYYSDTNYEADSFEVKKNILTQYIMACDAKYIWDLGANTGIFSRIASNQQRPTLSFDIDPVAVEKNYIQCKREKDTYILPLILDLTNPSPGIGWMNRERGTIFNRNLPDTVIALALIHHIAISKNTPLGHIADFFHAICNHLIIEFIPKEDSQVQRLLSTREDVFPEYTATHFEDEFQKKFNIAQKQSIQNTERTLYLMTSR